MGALWKKYNDTSLILRIFIGLFIGLGIGIFFPQAKAVGLLGDVFVGALKGVAPILVFVLVMSSLMSAAHDGTHRFRTTIILYVGSTFIAALIGVAAGMLFPSKLPMNLAGALTPDTVQTATVPADSGDVVVMPEGDAGVVVGADTAPTTTGDVMGSILQQDNAVGAVALVTQDSALEILNALLRSLISSPIDSLLNANYIGILFWSVFIGFIMKDRVKGTTKQTFRDISDSALQLMYRIINLAPFGIIGLAYSAVATTDLNRMISYFHLLNVLIGCMVFMCLIVNPLIGFLMLGKNPYPLLWICLKRSAVTAFATRSSAANIPVNMGLCRRLGLNEDIYSVTIPLGATIHLNGAAITISVMTMAVAYTLGVKIDFMTALMLAGLAAFGACGSSGVTGGSLFILPMVCGSLGIPTAYAMQAVGAGIVIAILQDSFETALNSSGDVLITAIAEHYERQKNGESTVLLPD